MKKFSKLLSVSSLTVALLSSSLIANELPTEKTNTIDAFKNIPTKSLASTELETQGEWYINLFWGAVRLGNGEDKATNKK